MRDKLDRLDRCHLLENWLTDLQFWIVGVRYRNKFWEMVTAMYFIWALCVVLTALWLSSGLMAWLEGER